MMDSIEFKISSALYAIGQLGIFIADAREVSKGDAPHDIVFPFARGLAQTASPVARDLYVRASRLVEELALGEDIEPGLAALDADVRDLMIPLCGRVLVYQSHLRPLVDGMSAHERLDTAMRLGIA